MCTLVHRSKVRKLVKVFSDVWYIFFETSANVCSFFEVYHFRTEFDVSLSEVHDFVLLTLENLQKRSQTRRDLIEVRESCVREVGNINIEMRPNFPRNQFSNWYSQQPNIFKAREINLPICRSKIAVPGRISSRFFFLPCSFGILGTNFKAGPSRQKENGRACERGAPGRGSPRARNTSGQIDEQTTLDCRILVYKLRVRIIC